MEKVGSTKTALITGASSGIGLSLAKLFAADGYALVAIAHDAVKLEAAATDLRSQFHVPIETIAIDLSTSGASQNIMDQLAKRNIVIDVLVNNAGYALRGNLLENDPKELDAMLHINMITVTDLIRLIGPGMLARKSGKILNIASTAAFQAGPRMGAYYGTKAYVLLLSEALARELKGTGVTVTCLCPGPTMTGFVDRAGVRNTFLFKYMAMQPDAVARIGYTAMHKGKTLVIAGFFNRLLVFGARFVPRNVATWLSAQTIKR